MRYMEMMMIKRDVNRSKVAVDLASRDTVSDKITRTRSKNPVQKRHLSLYGPPYASKKGFMFVNNFWQQHMYFDRGPSNNGMVRR